MALLSTTVLQGDPILWTQYDNLRSDLLGHTHDGVDTPSIRLANTQYLTGIDNLAAQKNLIGISNLNVVTIGASGLTVEIPVSTTITAGNLRVSAGTVGVGGAAPTDSMVYVPPNGPYLAGTAQYGVQSTPMFSSGATAAGTALFGRVTTQAAAYTMGAAYAVRAANPNKGAGSAISTNIGLIVDAMTAGSSENYGVYINAPSGGTTNVSLYSLGQAWFADRIALTANANFTGAGSIYKNATYGMALWGVTGGSYDFAVFNNAGNAYLLGIAGTQRVHLPANLGVGGAPIANAAVQIVGSILSTGTNQYGIATNPTYSSAATASGNGVYAQIVTAATAFTMGTAFTFYVANPSKGAGSVITSNYGIFVEAMTAGGTNNFGVYINAPSGGASNNYGLYNLGTSRFDANVAVGTAPVSFGGVYVTGAILSGAANQYGVVSAATQSSAATSTGQAFYGYLQTAAASFTMGSGYGVVVDTPVIGAGSAVTNLHGVHVNNQGAAGVTNAVGVYIAAQSGAATTNYGLYNAGTTMLVGNTGFFGATPAARQTVTGSRSGGAALVSLLTALVTLGLITDSTSA